MFFDYEDKVMMNLREQLLKWDGKHTDFLIEVYVKNQMQSNFLNDIIHLYIKYADLEHATTWIIKYFVYNGNELDQSQTKQIISKIGQLEYWESQLHVLQLISKMSLTSKNVEFMEPSVNSMMESEKKFVKASAYEAYFEMVKLIPKLKDEFIVKCETALEKESASIKSKLRKIIRQVNGE